MRVNKVLVAAGLGLGGWFVLQRLGRRWGATDEEVFTMLPGDGLIPAANMETTHAITIQAPPAAVWPWLVQAGFHRGAWYTDAWWEDLINRGIARMGDADHSRDDLPWPSADRILPEFQDLKVGDIVPDGPPGTAYFTVRTLEPERCMVLYSDSHLPRLTPKAWQDASLATSGEFVWIFNLSEPTPNTTRLIVRSRGMLRPQAVATVLSPLLLLGDFLFARQMLNGIKRRAEGAIASA